MAERVPFAHYLARMAAAGFRPSTVRGQNFLLDPSLHRWLAAQARAGAGDTVVEIGVGLGFLTRELAAVAGRVVGIEIDERLLAIARPDLRGCDNIELVAADALSGPDRTLIPVVTEAIAAAQASGGQGYIVANLPYSVSGPLLAEITALPALPDRAVLLVQKELAQRIAAVPGSQDYGGLSVSVQASFVASIARDVSPQVFRPRPKVTSSVLVLERRADPLPALAGAAQRRRFGRFVRALFQQRRKVLRSTLPQAAAAVGLAAPPVGAAVLAGRAEKYAPDVIAGWWQACPTAG